MPLPLPALSSARQPFPSTFIISIPVASTSLLMLVGLLPPTIILTPTQPVGTRSQLRSRPPLQAWRLRRRGTAQAEWQPRERTPMVTKRPLPTLIPIFGVQRRLLRRTSRAILQRQPSPTRHTTPQLACLHTPTLRCSSDSVSEQLTTVNEFGQPVYSQQHEGPGSPNWDSTQVLYDAFNRGSQGSMPEFPPQLRLRTKIWPARQQQLLPPRTTLWAAPQKGRMGEEGLSKSSIPKMMSRPR